MIRLQCPACGKVYHVQDDRAGKQTRCLVCREPITIPPRPTRTLRGESGWSRACPNQGGPVGVPPGRFV
jgi:hypothetical protein